MRGGQYLKDQLPVLMINLLGMLALALFLMANGNGLQIILFILAYDGAVRRAVFAAGNHGDAEKSR